MKYAVTIAALSLALVLAACGGDGNGGQLTLEEYFQELDEIDNDLEARTDEIDQDLENVFGDSTDPELTDEVRQSLTEALEAYEDAFNDFASDIEDLNPPDEVRSQHDEVVETSQRFAEGFGQGIEDAADAETVDDMFGFFAGLEADGARLDEICLDLRQVATDNGIETELDCENEE